MSTLLQEHAIWNKSLQAIQEDDPTTALKYLAQLPLLEINRVGEDENTLLSHALIHLKPASIKLVKTLIEKGASLIIRDSNQQIILARMVPYPELIKTLFTMPLSAANFKQEESAGTLDIHIPQHEEQWLAFINSPNETIMSEDLKKAVLSELLLPFERGRLYIHSIRHDFGIPSSAMIQSLQQQSMRVILTNLEHRMISQRLDLLPKELRDIIKLQIYFLSSQQEITATTLQEEHLRRKRQGNREIVGMVVPAGYANVILNPPNDFCSMNTCRKLVVCQMLLSLTLLAGFVYFIKDKPSSGTDLYTLAMIAVGLGSLNLIYTLTCCGMQILRERDTRFRHRQDVVHEAIETIAATSITIEDAVVLHSGNAPPQTGSRYEFWHQPRPLQLESVASPQPTLVQQDVVIPMRHM